VKQPIPTEGMDPRDTATEMTWIVMPSQANALGTVFGGQIMAWVDVCAAISAQRLARTDVVTANVDELTFVAPVRQGHICVVRSMVNWVGRTSMEVGVRVEGEDPYTGVRTHTTSAYLTFVARGPAGPVLVPPLAPKRDEEVRRWNEACLRRESRLQARRRLMDLRGEAGP
jgi:acyl-CoA hydrolase